VQFSAVLDSEIGYAVNPFLVGDLEKGSIFASASAAPKLVYAAARSTTTLQGKYTRETYLHDFGYTDHGTISLERSDQLSQFLHSVLSAGYETSNRAIITDPTQVQDPFNIGRRTKTIHGTYQLQWQASAMDQLSYGAQIQHLSYGKGANTANLGTPSAYTQYAVNAGYNRVVDARTSVGAQVALSTVRSRLYPDSRVVQPSLTAKRQLTAVWELDGHIGMVFQHIEGPFASSHTSLGFGANLCGAYPHTHLCLTVTHDTQPSGYGSLRTETSIGGTVTHEFDERSRVKINAQYLRNSSDRLQIGGTLIPSNVKAVLASADYDRDITQRISAGFGGKYQQRELTGLPSGHSYTASIHVTAKLGRM
jgi:hypothetical protein